MIDIGLGPHGNGQSPLVEVLRATNGWLVIVHHHNRDVEVSPETAALREQQKLQQKAESKEREKQRILRDMKYSLANIAVVGEAAGKAQLRGIEEEVESWKSSEELPNIYSDEALSKLEDLAQKLVDETEAEQQPISFNSFFPKRKEAETYIFSDRQEMIDFVSKMLLPTTE